MNTTKHDSHGAVAGQVDCRVRPLAERLASLARMSHYVCEDSWYSCPKHEDGSTNEDKAPDECDCGADQRNAEVDALAAELLALLPAA